MKIYVFKESQVNQKKFGNFNIFKDNGRELMQYQEDFKKSKECKGIKKNSR